MEYSTGICSRSGCHLPVRCISIEYITAKRDVRPIISHEEGQCLSEAKPHFPTSTPVTTQFSISCAVRMLPLLMCWATWLGRVVASEQALPPMWHGAGHSHCWTLQSKYVHHAHIHSVHPNCTYTLKGGNHCVLNVTCQICICQMSPVVRLSTRKEQLQTRKTMTCYCTCSLTYLYLFVFVCNSYLP